MDDNQFSRKPIDDPLPNHQHPAKPADDDVIDLYSEFNDPLEGKLDPEVEELKRLAQSDALKAYGWVRRVLASGAQRIDKFIAAITPKQIKLAKIGAVVLLIGIGLARVVPNIYQNLTDSGNTGILGESEVVAPDFDTLANATGAQNGLVFDPDAKVASFQDTIGGHSVIISQQEIPAAVSSEQGGVEKLALSLNNKATINRYETDKGQIYVIAAQNGSQTVIFGYEHLLVFLRMDAHVDEQLWVDYVNQLKL